MTARKFFAIFAKMKSGRSKQTVHQRELAARVEDFRRRNGLRQKALADNLGCSVATVSRVIRGEIGMAAHLEDAMRNMVAAEDLTARQEKLVSMMAAMTPKELEAVSQILQIMQNLRT